MSASDAEANLVVDGDQRDAVVTSAARWRGAIMPMVFVAIGIVAGFVTHAATQEKVVAPLTSASMDGTVSLTFFDGIVGLDGVCGAARCSPGSTCCRNDLRDGYCCSPGNECRDNVCVVPFGLCFAGRATLDVKGRGSTAMADVSIGDEVLVRNSKSALDYQPVLGFLHTTSAGSTSTYLKVVHSQGKLHVSPNHIVFLADGSDKLAGKLVVGDELAMSHGQGKVLAIEDSTGDEGMYAPFTAAGTVVVDGVVASTYATHSETTWIPHAAIHTAFFPLRLYFELGFGGNAIAAKPEVDAIHPFADFLHKHVGRVALQLLPAK